jgi:protein-tyrosine kinase
MSRVHDALRRAESPKPGGEPPAPAPPSEEVRADGSSPAALEAITEQATASVDLNTPAAEPPAPAPPSIAKAIASLAPAPALPSDSIAESPAAAFVAAPRPTPQARPAAPHAQAPPSPASEPPQVETERRTSYLPGLFGRIEVVPFNPAPDASLLDIRNPQEGPSEEFRGIRTRLNHLQSQRPIRTVVVSSPSPAEGKSFTAANLGIAQAQLEGAFVLLADFDFRRPAIHRLFQVDRTPGLTDYLQGKVTLEETIKRVEGTNLFLLPAGEVVNNPLELLNLPEAKRLLDYLATLFRWILIDTPPLLFAADANLISTLCDGTIMVVRMGATTVDSITRAMGSLCQNNVLGIVANAAPRSELYSKFTYYQSYYYSKTD